MLESAQKAQQFIKGMTYEEFARDDKTIYAVIRAVEIIGEAVKNIPKDLQETYSDVPWREIAGTRDKLVHEYFGVNLSVIWRTTQEDLPELISHLENMLNDFGYSQK
jgi:uncharacterized protein with HEPN domain